MDQTVLGGSGAGAVGRPVSREELPWFPPTANPAWVSSSPDTQDDAVQSRSHHGPGWSPPCLSQGCVSSDGVLSFSEPRIPHAGALLGGLQDHSRPNRL